MKNTISSRIISIITSVIIATSGFVSLFIDGVVKPFLENYQEVKLVIILISVLSAYHAFLSSTFSHLLSEEISITNDNIETLSNKIKAFNDLIHFSYLDEIERNHGRNSTHSGTCEIWIIANTLQESKIHSTTDDILYAIYDNITKYKVHYYYILPQTEKSKREINSFNSSLREIHKKKKRRNFSGGISYLYDSRYAETILSDYFDIVLYIDCDEEGKPCFHGDSSKCEGYQCYSNLSDDNNYFYQKINNDDKIFGIREEYDISEFHQLII